MLSASKTQPTRAELLKHEREARALLTEKRGRLDNIVPRRKP
jgi:hypothetical protein